MLKVMMNEKSIINGLNTNKSKSKNQVSCLKNENEVFTNPKVLQTTLINIFVQLLKKSNLIYEDHHMIFKII